MIGLCTIIMGQSHILCILDIISKYLSIKWLNGWARSPRQPTSGANHMTDNNPLNFIQLKAPTDILDVTPKDGTKIFLTGYSAAPKDSDYAAATEKYLTGLVDGMKGKTVTLITSPTATGESIDAIA